MSYMGIISESWLNAFKRAYGVPFTKFNELLEKVSDYIEAEKKKKSMKRRGKKSIAITLQGKLLLTLCYLRQYPTYQELGRMFKISESYANKIFHSMLDILVNILKVKGRKELMNKDLEVVIIDATEQPIERPVQGQKAYYSGKKKQHTIKAQLVTDKSGLEILALNCQKGHVHDFRVLIDSQLPIHHDIKKLLDSGYQGVHKIYANTETPIKKTKKKKKLTKEEKKHNRSLAKVRVKVEHVIRRCKIFRITKETYRGKHKNYGKTWNIVAGLVNLRYAE